MTLKLLFVCGHVCHNASWTLYFDLGLGIRGGGGMGGISCREFGKDKGVVIISTLHVINIYLHTGFLFAYRNVKNQNFQLRNISVPLLVNLIPICFFFTRCHPESDGWWSRWCRRWGGAADKYILLWKVCLYIVFYAYHTSVHWCHLNTVKKLLLWCWFLHGWNYFFWEWREILYIATTKNWVRVMGVLNLQLLIGRIESASRIYFSFLTCLSYHCPQHPPHTSVHGVNWWPVFEHMYALSDHSLLVNKPFYAL